VNDHDRLGRNLRDALPADFQSGPALDRIMRDVSRRPRRPAVGLLGRSWLGSVAGFVAGMALMGLLDGQWAPVSANAGRVEMVGKVPVEFVSSTGQPPNEFRAMTTQVLAGFNGRADFYSQDTGADDITRIQNEQAAGHSTVDVIALTYSDMLALQAGGDLEDLTPLLKRLETDRRFAQPPLDDARFGTSRQYAIPWLQATYLMAVNKKALPYLPQGADVRHLTYDELVAWGQNMQAASGGVGRIGLPADVNSLQGGLVYRFLQGYTYPSYTGTTLTGFRSPDAVSMWEMLQRLWAVTNTASKTYSSMSDPLLSGDVWVAWDHQARLAAALADTKDFIAVPAPTGPRGQGYMTAEVDLAIPKGTPNQQGAEALIEWLTREPQQAAAAASLSFFPAVEHVQLAGPQAPELAVDHAYRTNPAAIETIPAVGLGGSTNKYTGVYQDTFRRIVIGREDIQTVLDDEAPGLQKIVDDADAPCWRPDLRSRGPCRIR
jgi:multiple sugar transport system substrate-binding protein